MSNLRRYYRDGGSYFVTCVTFDRKPILLQNLGIFWRAVEEIRAVTPFDLSAWVVIPDHFHWIITPQGQSLSDIMRRIKVTVGARYRQRFHISDGRFWQNRFWDHVIRNEADLERHANYIHYNPVKHGLAAKPEEYAFSSLQTFIGESELTTSWSEVAKYEGKHGE